MENLSIREVEDKKPVMCMHLKHHKYMLTYSSNNFPQFSYFCVGAQTTTDKFNVTLIIILVSDNTVGGPEGQDMATCHVNLIGFHIGFYGRV